MGAGPPTAAGQDLQSPHGRRAGLLPRGGGRGAGSWWPRSCSLSTCRRQTARAQPGRRLPPSGCSGGAGGGARAEPEPSRCPSPARYRGRCWAGRPCHCSRRLRVRAGGPSSAGKGEAPAPLQSFGEVLSPHIQACASGSCPSVSSAPPSTLCSRVTRAAPRVLTPGARGLAAGLLGTCNG